MPANLQDQSNRVTSKNLATQASLVSDGAEQPRWDDARIFLAAYREKSFGNAARKLALDTSTVSRRLAIFEQSLGTRLFERTRDGLIATPSADHVLAAAEAMEFAHGRLNRDATDDGNRVEGVVRLSVAPGLVDLFIAPRLAKLRARYPKLCLEIDASTRAIDLSRHEADLALRSIQPEGAELVITKLGTASWVAVGSPNLVKRLGTLRQWNDAPWIAWDRDLASFGPSRWLKQYAPKAEIALRTSHFISQIIAAESGLGIVLVPSPYARLRKLVPVKVSRELAESAKSLPSDGLWLVGHRALRSVPRIAAVWDFLANEVRANLKP